MNDLTHRIEKKLEKNGSSQEIKNFILDILRLEFEKGARWAYSRDYEKLIKKFSEQYKPREIKHEN